METIDRLPWQALKFFYHVARLGRLDAAAAHLCVTSGAVSKQIKGLEQALGMALFGKQGRHVVLTPAGKQLQDACTLHYAALGQALTQMAVLQSDLRVSCEPTLAMRWLIPRLPDFKQQHPDINVVILAAGGAVDFAGQHVDVAIRRNDFVWPKQLFAEHLVDEWMAPVNKSGAQEQTQLHSLSRPHAWQQWLHTHSMAAPTQSVSFEHFYLALQAATAGLGMAMASVLMVADDVQQGILTAVGDFAGDGSAYYLLSARDMQVDAKTQVFLQWLRRAMQDTITMAGLN